MFEQFSVKTAVVLRDFLKRHSAVSFTQDKRRIAIFDADGTLWRSDIGDRFMDYQTQHGLLKPCENGQAFEAMYQEAIDQGREYEAYSKFVQWHAGATEDEVFSWAGATKQGFEQNYFTSQKELIAALHDAGIEVWVVSASPWWMVVAAVETDFGVPRSRIVAGKTRVDGGRITSEFEYPFPYKTGKVDAIRKVIGEDPIFVAGNSMGDFEMMNLATELVLVMNSAKPGDPYFETEQMLRNEALARKSGPVQWVVEEVK